MAALETTIGILNFSMFGGKEIIHGLRGLHGLLGFRVLIAVVVAAPLALAPGLYFFDTTPKLLALMLGAGLLWAVMPRQMSFRVELAWLLGAQAVLTVLATVFSTNPVLSLVGSEWRRLGLPATLACLAVAAAVLPMIREEPRRQRFLLASLAGAGGLVALYSLAQYAGVDPWIDRTLYTVGEGEWAILRPPGTLGYVSYLGTFLLYVIFSAAGLALTAQRAVARGFWVLVILAAALALLVSGSRGAWLGGLVGAVVLLSALPQRRKYLFVLLGFTVLAGALVLSPAGEPLRSRLRWFVEDPGGGSRLWLWRDSLRMSLRHPLLGGGPDTFERIFPPFESTELASRFPDRYIESPHNVVLDHLSVSGFGGAIAFLLLALAALRNFSYAANRAETEDERRLARSLLAATAAALVSQQFIADTIPTRLYFLVFASLSYVCVGKQEIFQPGPALRWGLRLAGVAALAFTVVFGVALLRADRAMHQARAAALRGDLQTVLAQGREAIRLFPWAGTYPMAFSRLLGGLLMNPKLQARSAAYLLALAEEAARKALPAAASPQLVAVHLASLYGVEGRFADAGAALETAIRAAPQWYRPHWLLAELHQQQGRREQAASEARLALQLGARSHPEVAARCLGMLRN